MNTQDLQNLINNHEDIGNWHYAKAREYRAKLQEVCTHEDAHVEQETIRNVLSLDGLTVYPFATLITSTCKDCGAVEVRREYGE